MRIYNTLSRQIEEIVPSEPGMIRMYSCGPTVYRSIHIGNLRTFAMADWLRRALEYQGLRVLHVKNITDVGHMRQEALDRGEDKIIAQARQEGKSAAEIAAFYTEAFHADERAMNILPAHVFPRATDHIGEMIAIVADLLARDVAYEVEGNVFFDVTRFPRYGALSGNQLAHSLRQLQDQASTAKRHPEDFPLWKAAEPGREMAWDSPWGRGFPGWHIECSAMAIRHLGPHLDIHTGGVDNIFPHHEDEIAQSEAHTEQPFARYWVHAQHLLCDGLKMAKSSGNAYTLADLTRRGFEPAALRYLFTTAHYRSRINFTFRSLRAAQTGLHRLRLALLALAEGDTPLEGRWEDDRRARQHHEAFLSALDDDLNLPRAMAALWEMLRPAGAPGAAVPHAARLALAFACDRILGLGLRAWVEKRREHACTPVTVNAVPREVAELAFARAAARVDRDYARADALRAQIRRAGFALGDTARGPLLARRRPAEDLALIAGSDETPDRRAEPDRADFSVLLIGRDNRQDLARCLESVRHHGHGQSLELVIVENGSSDETPSYLRTLAQEGLADAQGRPIATQIFFADHDLGFAAARNAAARAARGRILVWLDTSIELAGAIWTLLTRALDDPSVGLAGPYALVTDDLKEFHETMGPEADAVEGYLLAFRRALLTEIGPLEEKFRFYRLADIYLSLMVKAAGYRVLCVPAVAERIVKHPHREWYALTPEEQAARSKKNFDLFRRRWHHGQSLLVENFVPADRWPGHDHGRHVDGAHTHAPHELPSSGTPHTHEHRHWPDHSHTHPHLHGPIPQAPMLSDSDRNPWPS